MISSLTIRDHFYVRLPCDVCAEIRMANPYIYDLRVVTDRIVKDLNNPVCPIIKPLFVNNLMDGTVHINQNQGSMVSFIPVSNLLPENECECDSQRCCGYWGIFGNFREHILPIIKHGNTKCKRSSRRKVIQP